MSIFKSIISPMQNCDEIAIRFCQLLRVKVTATSLRKKITEHPDYPSLLSISDTLRIFKVANLGLKTTTNNFHTFPTPFIVQVKGNKSGHNLFGIINELLPNQKISWYNPEKKKNEQTSKNDFNDLFTGYVMLAESNTDSGETEYEKKRNEQRMRNFWNTVIALILPILLLLIIGYTSFMKGFLNSFFPICFALVTLAGTITGALLLLYEVDQHNPVLQKVCHSGKKTNCGAILNSEASHIWGISWSSIGFAYFCGMLIALMTTSLTGATMLSVAALCNLLALPYIFFSLYYQGLIARQWCPMCLTVQASLVLQFLIALGGHFLSIPSQKEIPAALAIATCFGVVFLSVQLLIPSLQRSKEGKHAQQELVRLKHNPEVFETLLEKQKKLDKSADGLGITLGNTDGKIKLIKVCNPYCGPCALAHPVIEELLENNPELQVQIIFTASGEDNDYKNPPVQHLLAIANIGDESLTRKALDDWYKMDEKNYDVFAQKYPMNGELEKQSQNIKEMNKWNESEKIAYTPTIFINDHQLPEIYNVSDLKYLLSD